MKFCSAGPAGFVRIVPKRAFATPADEAAFRLLAATTRIPTSPLLLDRGGWLTLRNKFRH